MTPKEYIEEGKFWQRMGRPTDGCSFVGWLMPDKYTPACWAHDYGRTGLIYFEYQSDNDNMFRNALRYLGMSDRASNLIYYFTRSQGWFRDKTGLPAGAFIGLFAFLAVVAVLWWLRPLIT